MPTAPMTVVVISVRTAMVDVPIRNELASRAPGLLAVRVALLGAAALGPSLVLRANS